MKATTSTYYEKRKRWPTKFFSISKNNDFQKPEMSKKMVVNAYKLCLVVEQYVSIQPTASFLAI